LKDPETRITVETLMEHYGITGIVFCRDND
jgi:hypothetical protein